VFEKVMVFDSDKDGYASTRDPALCITPKGTLFAFCEARADGAGDWASIDLLMRRSTDHGKTWSDTTIIANRTLGMPTHNLTPIVEKDGTIHLLYFINYARAYHIVSKDEGISWSPPTDITYVFEKFRPEYNWKVIATGPNHGTVLRNGRLLAPAWLCDPDPTIKGGHRPSCVATIYSDDHGETWKRGDIVVNNSAEVPNPSETHAVELENGNVMLNIRNESPKLRRLQSISPDGAANWSKPVFVEDLFEPVCNAAIERLSYKKTSGKSRILFCNPDSEADTIGLKNKSRGRRTHLTLKLSYDEGKTYPVKKLIDAGRSGYCDMVVGSDGTIYILYEQGERNNSGTVPQSLYLVKTNLEWLTDNKDKL
jgi:sialidase-1